MDGYVCACVWLCRISSPVLFYFDKLTAEKQKSNPMYGKRDKIHVYQSLNEWNVSEESIFFFGKQNQ